MNTINQTDDQERTDVLNIMIEKIKLEEWYVSELSQRTRANQQLSNQNESLNLAADEFDASIQSDHAQSSKEVKRLDGYSDFSEHEKLKKLLDLQSRQLQKQGE